MPISGVVIGCEETAADRVAARLSEEGYDIRGVLPGGKVVAVIEADSVDGEVDLVSDIGRIDGVITVNVAYHNFEDLTAG